MTIRTYGLAALAASLLVSSGFAQDIEPNQTKAEATANGTIVLSAGGTITGTSTGTVVTTGSTLVTTVDTYRVKTGALPIGLYQHRLTLTSPVVGHTGTLRGWGQTGTTATGGTAGTLDTQIQASLTTTTPPRFNQWYGFGKQEEIFYRVAGTATTTAAYTATLSTTPITPTAITPPFEAANPVTISTGGQTTVDTEMLLYDSNFNLLVQNDNNSTSSQSTITTTLAPGTYYVGISTFELCISQVSPPTTEFFFGGLLTDFPDAVILSDGSLLTADWDFTVTGSNGLWSQTNQRPINTAFGVTWYSITTANGAPPIPPPNDNCASAISVGAGGTLAGTVLNATNDGTASCDPGGALSRDVWYSYTNPGVGPRLLTVSTCGTTGINDTVVSIHNTCGGADVICNDDNPGCAAQPTTSLISGYSVNGGQTVRIRVSDKNLGGAGGFTIQTSVVIPPPPNDDCTTPAVLTGLGVKPVSNAAATTGAQGQADPLCINVGGTPIRQDVWYTWVAPVGGSVELTTCGLLAPGGGSQDTKIAVYNGAGCPAALAIACNDDDPGACGGFASKLSFTAVCGNTYTFQFGMYQGSASTYEGGLAINSVAPPCSTPFTPECIGDTVAACPCSGGGGSLVPNPGAAGNGCANSSFAAGANLSSSGIAQDNAGDTLVLTCSGMPGPGLFFQSNALGGPFVNFNDGILCAAVGIIRMGVVFPDGGGNASYPGGLTPAPIHIAGAPVLAPNPTKHYQCWYRDITPGFCNTQGHNMSNGIAITWTP